MLFRDAPNFSTNGPTYIPVPAVKKVRFTKTRKSKRHTSTRTTRKNTPTPEQPKLNVVESLWESYKSAVATITHLTKSSVN